MMMLEWQHSRSYEDLCKKRKTYGAALGSVDPIAKLGYS